MGEEEDEAPPPRRAELSRRQNPQRGSVGAIGNTETQRRKLWRLLTWAAALALTVPVWMGAFGAKPPIPDTVAVLWFASLVFLLFRLLAWGYRRVFGREARHGEAGTAGGWALGLQAIGCAGIAYMVLGLEGHMREATPALTVLVLLAVVGFIWKLGQLLVLARRRGASLVPRNAARGEAQTEGGGNGQVAWLVGLPSSSPSREDAERQLPDYCARLMAS